MIVLFPFCERDFLIAQKWMAWAAKLKFQVHSIILMPAKEIPDYERIQSLATEAFGNVSALRDCEGIKGHPEGPNSMMRQAVWHMQMNNLGPWTYWEPDCIPLTPNAIDIWEREYLAFQKPFMGEFRPANGVAPDYLSGNMVLPANALLEAPMLARRGLSVDGVELAFDIVAATQTLPKAHLTKLLHQVPKQENGDGTHFPDQESLRIIRTGAVMFHPCKDGSLIDRLMERKALEQFPVGPSGLPTHQLFQVFERSDVEAPPIESDDHANHVQVHMGATLQHELSVALARITELENTIANLRSAQLPSAKSIIENRLVIPRKQGKQMKKKRQRTTQQVAADKARMAKVRAARGAKV